MPPKGMTQKEWVNFTKTTLGSERDEELKGLTLVFPHDLRASMDMKCVEASKKTAWTAFVNNAGNLCHVVCPEGWIMVRVTFGNPIKHFHRSTIKLLVLRKVEKWIRI